MGAESFNIHAIGVTAAEAFKSARTAALWNYGHSGYTGTIAEKDGYVMVPVPSTMPTITIHHRRDNQLHEERLSSDQPRPMTLSEYADHLNDDSNSPVDDKWGPAGCFQVSSGKWLFFGWASS